MSVQKEYLFKKLEKKGDLPPLPKILSVLEKKINDPDEDIYSIADLIESDAVLSGKILKLANSTYFAGGREKAEEPSEALLRLGLKNTLDLAYSVLIPNLFVKVYGLNQIQFWRHSLCVALLAQSLAQKLKLKKETMEMSYLSGLMHDVGILVFEYLIPEDYTKFKDDFMDPGKPLNTMEDNHFGVCHSVLGARFIQQSWKLPENLVRAVARTHSKEDAKEAGDELALLVGFANRIANNREIGNGCDPAPDTVLDEDLEEWCLTAATLDQETDKVLETLANAESLLS